MSPRTPADADRWMHQGTKLFADALGGLDDAALDGPTGLPGWTGRQLVAHVAANADALGNLVHWAATGEETPMYPTPEQRLADIEAGANRPPTELREWFAASARRLVDEIGSLSTEQLTHQVRTAQGRQVPATEIVWLRSREVMVHAVDLGALAQMGEEICFDDLPGDFLSALVDDIVVKRAASEGPALLVVPDDAPGLWAVTGSGEPIRVNGHLAEIAAYLAGRASALDGTVPVLPRWL